jgi:hypothetical protein
MTRTREKNAADLAREQQWLESLVRVYVAVTGEPTHLDDEGVPGVYLVEVEPDLTEEEKADTALDIFHENCAISLPEDFNIDVFSESGNLLITFEKQETGTFCDRGRWGDQMSDERIPAAIKAAMRPNEPPAP